MESVSKTSHYCSKKKKEENKYHTHTHTTHTQTWQRWTKKGIATILGATAAAGVRIEKHLSGAIRTFGTPKQQQADSPSLSKTSTHDSAHIYTSQYCIYITKKLKEKKQAAWPLGRTPNNPCITTTLYNTGVCTF